MGVQHCCRSPHIELTCWKANVYDLVSRLDRVDTGDKGKIVSQVDGLHTIVEELSDSISKLESECPTEWHPARAEIQIKLQTLGYKWEGAWQGVAGGDVGG